MPRAGRRRHRPPEVLRRVYGNRVRRILDAILSFLPSPPPLPSPGSCPYGRCLRCVPADERKSWLVRLGDPADYRRLLTRGFAVVHKTAPPFPADFDPRQLHDHRQIVQIFLKEPWRSPSSSFKYELVDSNSTLDNLCGSAWHLLSMRVGDIIMLYLLKFSSIFLPLINNKYFEVNGSSRSNFYPRPKKDKVTEVHIHDFSSTNVLSQGPKNSGVKRVGNMGDSGDYVLADSLTTKKRTRPSSWQRRRQLKNMCSYASDTSLVQCERIVNCSSGPKNIGVRSVENIRDSGGPDLVDSHTTKKRTRPFSWQKSKHKRNMCFYTSDTTLVHCGRTMNCSSDYSSELLPDNTRHCFDPLTCSGERSSHEDCKKRELECPFFSLLKKSAQNDSRKVGIDRRPMLYKSTLCKSLFARQHILNKVKPNEKGALVVMENILRGTDSGSFSPNMMKFCVGERQCLCRSFLMFLKSLIKNVKRCQCLRILDKHCSALHLGLSDDESHQTETKLPLFRPFKLKKKYSGMISNYSPPDQGFSQNHEVKEPKQGNSLSGERSADMTKLSCSHASVVSFIWAICRSIVPWDFLGGPSMWRTLIRRISDFIKLRRFEKFNLKQCMSGLKMLDIPFLTRFRNLDHGFNHDVQITLKARFFRKWIFWFFSYLVMPLVAAHFYVTETSHCGYDVSYYHKRSWRSSMDNVIGILCEHKYRQLDGRLSSFLQNRTLGFSKARFLPKKSGLRTLINLRAPSSIIFLRGKVALRGKSIKKKRSQGLQIFSYGSVNSRLRDLHVILKRIKVEQPEMLGSSVFDYNDIYKKLCPFIINVRNWFMTTPDIFVFVCDVKKAFDNIDQGKLLEVMNAILQREKYVLREYPHTHCTKESLWVCSDRISLDSDYNTSITRHKDVLPTNSSHGVIFDEFSCKEIERSVLLGLLHEHVKGNLVQFGQHLWLQSVGISQGSILSPLLCSFYYAHLEKSVIFPLLEETKESFPSRAHGSFHDQYVTSSPDYLMMRLIDDILFISTSKMQTESLYCRLQRGISDYNCHMNRKKFYMNFDIYEPFNGLKGKRVYIGDDGMPFIPWSGLLINCQTLEIQADYARYCTSKMSSRITVSNEAQPNCQLKSKVCDYMRPKCHALFYDSNINSPRTVRLNVYQAFLLCAMKFHCLMCALPKSWELSPMCLLDIIEMSFRYMFRLIKERMNFMKCTSDLHPILNLKKEEVCLLAVSAYIRILQKKQSRHSKLLGLLKLRFGKYSHLLSLNDDMSYAVDDCHSSVFWKINF